MQVLQTSDYFVFHVDLTVNTQSDLLFMIFSETNLILAGKPVLLLSQNVLLLANPISALRKISGCSDQESSTHTHAHTHARFL